MNTTITLTQKHLAEFLLNVALIRPVFIWGPPGIGKSSLVQQFADQLGLPCVSLLGSQLAPEDIIGVPQIIEGCSVFCPPRIIARSEPYCLFLDELNACSHEVQKAFYSLIYERRVGEYTLPEGSIVIGAGNRTQDSAIVRPMSSALINRLIHVHLKVSHRDWLEWAIYNGIHTWVIEYIRMRPDHLWTEPPKHEEPFSTPRSWHMLSDTLHEYGENLKDNTLEMLAYGCLSPQHATQFRAFVKQLKNKINLNDIIEGKCHWPRNPEERDILYFLTQSFRSHLIKDLPGDKEALNSSGRNLAHNAKRLMKELAGINLELARMVTASQDNDNNLPGWFVIDLIRDLPRLAEVREAKK